MNHIYLERHDNRVENEQALRVSLATLEATNYNLDVKNPHTPEAGHSYSSTELLTLLHELFKTAIRC